MSRWVVLLSLVSLAAADLPIHCIHDQIFGVWEVSFTPSSGNINKCGYESPDRNIQHFTSYKEPSYEGALSYTVKLEAPAKLTVLSGESSSFIEVGNTGSWTMIYDEGMQLNIGNKKMFSFFEYAPKRPGDWQDDDIEGYNSNCRMTRTGWYHTNSRENRQYGCWKAQQTEAQNSNLMLQNRERDNNPLMVSPSSFMGFDSLIEKRSMQSPDAMFKFNTTFINEVNSNPSSTWTAKAHPHLHNKISMSQAYKMLGRSNFEKPSNGYDRRNYHHSPSVLIETMMQMRRRVGSKKASTESRTEKGEAPASFDWRNYIDDMGVVDQGDCGSCYAVASSKSFAMRHAIRDAEAHKGQEWWKDHHHSLMEGNSVSDTSHVVQFGSSKQLSTGDVLQCSTSNQGCAGGYPYLVGWFGDRRGMTNQQEGCSLAQRGDSKHPVEYEYIGGHYGAATEEKIIQDLWNNGPAVIAIDAPGGLFGYQSGVFQCQGVPHEGTNLPDLHPWEKTNHALVAVGWGEEEQGQKYWVIMNSWGENWGERGFFKLERNGNACAIGSMPVSIKA